MKRIKRSNHDFIVGMADDFAIKGDIIYCEDRNKLATLKDAFVVIKNGYVTAVQPDRPADINVLDKTGRLIIPAFTDLHTHAGQIANIGIGYDKTLLDWLNEITFPEEKRFENSEFAETRICHFVKELWKNGIIHSVIMPTLHENATKILINRLHQSGLYCYVGKVSMDRECSFCERTEDSIQSNKRLLDYCRSLKSSRIRYTLCPRFVLSCSSELMERLGDLSVAQHVPVHTHLSENVDEIREVSVLYKDSKCYAEVYKEFNLLGNEPTVMAHCVYSDRKSDELQLLRNELTWIAHCPTSNTNLQSGIAPVYKLYDQFQIGLGSDISGGHTMNMFEVMRHAIQVSKMLALSDKDAVPLTAQQAFYLATMGGGSFFTNVGSFLPGYKFNALVVSKHNFPAEQLPCALEQMIYTADWTHIEQRFVDGNVLEMPVFEERS